LTRYQWLLDRLLEDIRSGRYQPGDLLPTEHALMAQYGLSSTTVRRTLRELEARGVIYRRAGKGTFVRRAPLAEHLVRLTSFAEEMQAHNLAASFHLLSAEAVPAPAEVAQALALLPGQPVFLIKRLQLANDQVLALASGYWQIDLGRRLAAFDLNCCGLYAVLEDQLNIHLGEADEVIFAQAADPAAARLLNVPAGSPLLARRRVSYTREMQPVEYTTTLYPADRYMYRVRLLREDHA